MDNDFINFFGGILNSTKVEGRADFSDERELDRIWQEYNDYIQDLKDDGYKVLRNQSGKHKVFK